MADEEDARYGQFWFIAYHTLFWLDLFLTGSSEGFAPPARSSGARCPTTHIPKMKFAPISFSAARSAGPPSRA